MDTDGLNGGSDTPQIAEKQPAKPGRKWVLIGAAGAAVGLIALFSAAATGVFASKEEKNTVSMACTSNTGDVSLNVYVDLNQRNISVRNNKTRHCDIVRSVWVRIYSDEFQMSEESAGYNFFIDRKSGAFRYSTLGFEAARNVPVSGTCLATRYQALPKTIELSNNKF